MAHELILTSISHELAPDSSGVCIVAADREIPPCLVQSLTALSDYHHPFSPNTDDAALNPVVYSHVIVSGPNGTWSVLSRIADAGVDAQHRPNRLAHHIALRQEEHVKEGPAWLLALPGFHLTQWFTPAVQFEQCRPIPTLTVPPPLTRRQCIAQQSAWFDPRKVALTVPMTECPDAHREKVKRNEEQIFMAAPPTSPCPSWQEQVEDAGWGGVLAETVRTGQPVIVVYNPGLNIFPLFAEALALLPEPLRWKGTFSTYFTHLPEQVTCQWKGVLVDTPEAEKCLSDPNALVLDLTQPLGQAPEGPYVKYARYGFSDLLPTNENIENVFVSENTESHALATESDEQSGVAVTSSLVSSDLSAEKDMSTTPPSEKQESTSPNPSVTGPPIPPDNTFIVQPRTRPKKPGLIASLLTMKSRGGFYLLYGMTMLLVLVLLVLVLDQFADFGAVRWLRGDYSQAKVNTPSSDSGDGSGTNSASPLDTESVERERARLREQEQSQLEEEERRKQELEAAEIAAKKEAEEKRKQDANLLLAFLQEGTLPDSLPLQVPGIVDSEIKPPATDQLFEELSALYPYGSVLELSIYPLLDQPNLRIETRKQELEWNVVAIDSDSSKETLMFHLHLTEQGLRFLWAPPGMEPQHFFDTLWASLGFLRLSVAGPEENGKEADHGTQEGADSKEQSITLIRSIPLFRPASGHPIVLSKDFVGPDFAEKVMETPFAVEPWKTLFQSSKSPLLMFRLEAKIAPESSSDIEVKYPKGVLPAKFVAEIQTKIDAASSKQDGNTSYSPIVVPFQGAVDSFEKVVWSDGFRRRSQELQSEREDAKTRDSDIKKQITPLENRLRNAPGGTITAELEVAQKQLDELLAESTALNKRMKEIKNILEKLSSAHDSIIQNPRLYVEYSVSLAPVDSGPRSRTPRQANEKSLLLLKSDPVASFGGITGD